VTGRRLMYTVLAAVLLAPLLTGCGVPSSSRPVVVGAAMPNGSSGDQSSVVKQGPDRIIDAQELVRRYLRAVAWANEPAAAPEAIDDAKKFLTPKAASNWPSEHGSSIINIIVVHAQLNLPVTTATGIRVEVAMQSVGVLDSKGVVVPQTDLVPPTYQFSVVPAGDGLGLRIENPPDLMLLSDDALTTLYEPWPVYFWDSSGRTLVPDLRYISRALTPANRDVELTNLLRRGPSEYLHPAVSDLPQSIEIKDRLVRDGMHLRVNLSQKAADPLLQLPKFVEQLSWTLHWFTGTIDLQIEGQRQNLATGDMLSYNLAAVRDGQVDQTRFCIVDGRVRQLSGDVTASSALNNDANAGVMSAAILHGPAQQTALVRQESPGKVRLWLGAEQQDMMRYQQTDLVASSTSRPAGIVSILGSIARVLIAADGRLYDVPFDGSAARQKIDVTPQGIGAVSDVSVSPDGRRVALVAGGLAYVGVLQGPMDGSPVSVAQLRRVPVGLADVSAVAWSREEYIVVAGRSAGQSALVETTIDGALVTPIQLRFLPGLTVTVTRLVADPVIRPSDPPEGPRGSMMLEADGHSYNVYSGSVVDLATDPSFAAPSPAPSKQPPVVTAPFFLD
jgi:hypothetical protein